MPPLSFHQTKFFSQTPWNFKQDREAVGSLFAVFTVRYRHIVRGWLLIPRSVWLDRFHSLAPQAVQLSISTDVSYIQCVENSILKIKLLCTWVKKSLLNTQVGVMMKWLVKGPACDNCAICVWLWQILDKAYYSSFKHVFL